MQRNPTAVSTRFLAAQQTGVFVAGLQSGHASTYKKDVQRSTFAIADAFLLPRVHQMMPVFMPLSRGENPSRFINHLNGLFLNLFATWINAASWDSAESIGTGLIRKADFRFSFLRKYRDTTPQRHVQAHIDGQKFCCLSRIADFKNLALLIECNSFATKGGPKS